MSDEHQRELRDAHLLRAQHVVRERGEFRRRLRALGTVESRHALADALVAPPEWMTGSPAIAILALGRQIGEKRARRLLTQVNASELRRVGELTIRQRRRLAELVGDEPVLTVVGATVSSCTDASEGQGCGLSIVADDAR